MPSVTSACAATTLSCTVVLVLLFNIPIAADSMHPVVRVLSPQLAATLENSYAGSATIRALIDELEQSDLIVHVQGMGVRPHTAFAGTMRFVFTSGGRRFVRITVNERLSDDQRAAVLGHELQHAVEVARARFVTDQASLARLYRRIGYNSGGDQSRRSYETVAARRTGASVIGDLRAYRHSIRTSDGRQKQRDSRAVNEVHQ